MKYYNDFPTIPIGGSNPYHKCLYCGRSVPEINGRLERHADWCEYRINKEMELKIEPLKEIAMKWSDPQIQADLKLAQVVRLAFASGLSMAEWINGTSNEYRHIADNEIDLLKWADKL